MGRDKSISHETAPEENRPVGNETARVRHNVPDAH